MEIAKPKPVAVRDLDTPIRFHPVGDLHIGEAGCWEEQIARHVADIARDPMALVLLMGDLGGFIAATDRRWDPGSVADGLTIADLDDWGRAVADRVVVLLRPIAGRIIGSLEGNHEASWRTKGHGHVARWIAEQLGVPLLGYSCAGDLVFKAGRHERRVSFFATHGAGSAITDGAKTMRLVRTMTMWPEAQLVLVGHMHDVIVREKPHLVVRDGHVAERTQVGVVTGSYLRTYAEGASGYGERGGYPPAVLGHPVVEIVPSSGVAGVRRA